MSFKTLYCYLLIFSFFSINVFGQSKSKVDSSTVIIFNSPSNKDVKSYASVNILKISPISFITGRFPLTYERKITDFLSIQLSAGLTSKNYTRSLINNNTLLGDDNDDTSIKEVDRTIPSDISDLSDQLYNFDNRKSSLGYMISIQPRIYFESEALEGTFMGVSYELYKYNFIIPGLILDGGSYVHKGSEKKEFENIQDFNVVFGRQYLYDRISFELFTGIGLRSVKGEKYIAGTGTDNLLYEGISKYTHNTINFSAGIKVGYLF